MPDKDRCAGTSPHTHSEPRLLHRPAMQPIINCIDCGMMVDSAVKHAHMCCLTLEQGLELEEGFSPDMVKLLE